MRLSSFSPAYHEYEQGLDYYHGKDVVHRGNLLVLNADEAWSKINGKMRNKIRQAQKLSVDIRRVRGTKQEITDFRAIWFDPEDTTIPEELEPDEIMFMAYMEDELVGGLILTPSSPAVLYMHNLGSSAEGKRQNIPALLLWHAVGALETSGYRYIDVGVSFRPTLYGFFKNWQTASYPIIFSAPFIRPDLRLVPFSQGCLQTYTGDAPAAAKAVVTEYFGDSYTILPRAINCLKAILVHLELKTGDNVAVYKTFDNEYLTRCISEVIESRCGLSRQIDEHTKAVLVIHEFGFPYAELAKLRAECDRKGLPLIEDCAWAAGGTSSDGQKIGEAGDYAIYSLPKILPMQYGGILKGVALSDEELWSKYQMLDYYKREIVTVQLAELLPTLPEAIKARRRNWTHLAQLFAQDGFEVMGSISDDVEPAALVVKLDNFGEVFDRYTEFGVEAGRYYQASALYLPVHQNLSQAEVDYIYAVFRGKLNLSSDYRRDRKK